MFTRIRMSMAVAAVASTLLAAAPAIGGGFSVFEQGARGMGFAGAFTAVADDPSAIFHNPAGLAFLEGHQLYLGGTVVQPKSSFAGDAPHPGVGVAERADIPLIPLGTFYYSQPLGSTLAFGLGLDAPFGLQTRWANPDRYTGRFVSLDATLRVVSINPTLAWRIGSHVAVAGGLDARLSTVALKRRIPNLNPFTGAIVDIAEVGLSSDVGVGWGWNAGLLVKPSAGLSVGASYRHKVRIDYEGTATFRQISTQSAVLDRIVAAGLPSGSPAATTSIAFPAVATAGIAGRWRGWTLATDAARFRWSTFDRVDIHVAGYSHLDEAIIEDYTDSWQFRAGLERRFSDHFAIRGGVFYDQSPAPASSVSPLLPDADRIGYAFGWTVGGRRLTLDAAAWYFDFKERSTEGRNRDDYNGTYSNSALTVSASVGFRF
jgi:long-chain fatty acid transport protein